MLVALGSARAPKMRALQEVLRELRREVGPADVQALEVPSGVRETPLGRSEIMVGARNRVELARAQLPGASYWVGLEGGLHLHVMGAWLENWACVSNGAKTYFGCGGSIPLPDTIITEVVSKGRSLSVVIDELSGETDTRSREGAWGVLTGGRVTREEVFRRALMNAFAPFVSNVVY